MSSVVCQQKQCPFNNGVYCKKDFIMINQFAQCDEHWSKTGQPIPMRDLTVENVMKDKETLEKTFENEIENDEEKEENTEKETESNV